METERQAWSISWEPWTGSDIMRVLIIGKAGPSSLEAALIHALATLGHEAVSLHWPPPLRAPVPITIRFPRATGAMGRARRGLKRSLAGSGSVDLVIVVKGPYLGAAAIHELRTLAPVVCWNADDPNDFTIANRGAGVRDAVRFYDHYITWSPRIAEALAGKGPELHIVPFAWDPSAFYPSDTKTLARDRIVFVGTATEERIAWIREISRFHPLVFGAGWPKMPGVDLAPPVYGEDLRAAMTQAAVSLNFLRPQNRGTHNMRSFEIPGCHGRQLAEWSADHETLLDGTRAGFFRDPVELRAALSKPLPPADVQGLHAWLERHSYATRLELLLPSLTRPASRRGC